MRGGSDHRKTSYNRPGSRACTVRLVIVILVLAAGALFWIPRDRGHTSSRRTARPADDEPRAVIVDDGGVDFSEPLATHGSVPGDWPDDDPVAVFPQPSEPAPFDVKVTVTSGGVPVPGARVRDGKRRGRAYAPLSAWRIRPGRQREAAQDLTIANAAYCGSSPFIRAAKSARHLGMRLPLNIVSLFVVSLLAGLISACGSSESDRFEVVVIGNPDDPFETGVRLSRGGQLARAATSEGLVAFDAEGRIIPALADRWIVTDDGSSYIFRLRDGTWQDGSELTSKSALASLRRAISALRGLRSGWTSMALMKSVTWPGVSSRSG